MLMHDNSVIGLVDQQRYRENTINGGQNSSYKSDCCAIILDSSGKYFSAIHRDGSVFRQMSVCCIQEYLSLLQFAMVFRNGVVCNAPLFLSRNLFPTKSIETNSFAKWPVVTCEDKSIPYRTTSLNEVNKNLFLKDALEFNHLSSEWIWDCRSLHETGENIIVVDDGSVIIFGLHDICQPYLSLNPTGHFVKVTYAVNIVDEDPVMYSKYKKPDPLATRIAQVFSVRNLPYCFQYPLSCAQEIQHRFRRGKLIQHNASPKLNYVLVAFPSTENEYLDSTAQPQEQKHMQHCHNDNRYFDVGNEVNFDVSEVLSICSCLSSSDKQNYNFATKTAVVEQRDGWILRSTSTHQSQSKKITVEALLSDDNSCLILRESWDILHHYFICMDGESHVKFNERAYHTTALEYLESNRQVTYSLASVYSMMSSFLEQSVKEKKRITIAHPERKQLQCPEMQNGPEETHANNAGVFTYFPNGHVHVLFRDRTILDMPANSGFAAILLPNGVSREVDIDKPLPEFKIYIKLMKEFVTWILSSPLERQSAFEELRHKQRSVMAECSKISRFLVTNIDPKYADQKQTH